MSDQASMFARPPVPQQAMGMQPAPMQAMTPPVAAPRTLHNVTVVKRKKYGCCKVEPVPPEEFGITRRARSIHVGDSDYCFHEIRKTQSALIEDGYDPAQVDKLPDASDDTAESQARDTVDDSDDAGTAALNRATRTIKITEHYAKLDYEGNGKPKLYKVVTGSDAVLRKKNDKGKYELDITPLDMMPFAAATPIIMTHRFYGRSLADLVMDVMRIKTAIVRSGLDGIYLANNQRMEMAESHAGDKTLDDLLTNRPGGIVRTKTPGGLNPIPSTDIGGMVYPMLQYQDTVREWRTGITRQGQGIDAKSLGDQSATASAQMFTMAQARMRLIARIFAETGIRDLFLLMHGTIRKHGRSQQDTIRLRNKWVKIDPRDWKTRNDMTVNVGISAGSKMEQMAFLTNLLTIQREAIQQPQLGLVGPSQIYNTLKRLIPLGNLKSVEPYFTDPDEKDEQGQFVNRGEAPPNPEQMKAQAQMQVEQAKLQAKAQSDQAALQAQQQVDAMKLQMKQREEELKAQTQAFKEKAQAEADIIVERERTQSEMQLAAFQSRFDAVQANLDRQHEINLELIKQRGQERQAMHQAAVASQSQDKQIASDSERDKLKAKQVKKP